MNVEKRQRIERRIAREAIKGLLAEGYKISVFDGEETVLTKSVDPAAIEKAMFSTDEDQFHVERDGGEKPETGWVLFVYGNDGWDVIADNTVNLEPALKGATGAGRQDRRGRSVIRQKGQPGGWLCTTEGKGHERAHVIIVVVGAGLAFAAGVRRHAAWQPRISGKPLSLTSTRPRTSNGFIQQVAEHAPEA